MLFAYFTPDVAMPVATVVAAGVGFLMMVGRAPIRFVKRIVRSGIDRLKKGDGRRS
jgi:hypothetical protein